MKFILNEVASKIGDIIEKNPTKDIENNIKSLLTSALSKLNITTKEEFELQQTIILDLNDRVNKLEEKIEILLNNKKDDPQTDKIDNNNNED